MEDRRVVIGVLIVIAAGTVSLLLVLPPESSRFFGVCLVVAGVLNILLHRTIGRGHFRWSQMGLTFAAKFWTSMGEGGAQLLYLGIGVILVAGGVFLLIRSLSL